MAKGKRKNPTNRNQDHSPSSERSIPTPPSPGHPNTTEKLDPDLKAYLMMMVEDIIMRYAFKSGSSFKSISHDDGRGHQEEL